MLSSPRFVKFLLAALVLPMALLCAPPPADAQDYRGMVGRGWTYMEAGNFRKAEEAFKAAFATQDGKNAAEVYYAIAALWWERRNAMAAWMWLSDADKASKSSFTWDSGPDGVWDQRIAKRREYIARHFTAVRLRAPSRGAPLPPLADPPSSDPLLREFTDRLPLVISEGVEEKVAVQWVLLPSGKYWIGDEVVPLEGGELDASKAAAWELPKDGGKTRKNYDDRLAAISAGRSPAAEAIAAREQQAGDAARAEEEARLVADAAEKERVAREAAEANEREEREREDAAKQATREREEAEKQAIREREEADKQATREREEAAKQTAREREEAERKAARERDDAEKQAARERDDAEKQAARERDDAEKQAAREREEAERVADAKRKEAEDAAAAARKEEQRRTSEDRARNDASAQAARAEAERADEARRQAEWDAAQARMEEEQAREREADRLRKERLREERASSVAGATDEPFTRRRLLLTGGAGGASVGRMTDEGTSGEVDWAAQAELAYVAPLRGALGLPIGLSWVNLPVSGCSHEQTRANGVALHAGPRLATNLRGRLWLAGRIGGHLGGALTRPTGDVRNRCATASLAESGVAYGARLTGAAGGSARLSLADLGWNGWAVLVGPDADIGILGAPGAGNTYLGVSFFLRYDQVLPIVRGTAYHFQSVAAPEGSIELDSVTLNSISGRASMARVQFGLRGQILF